MARTSLVATGVTPAGRDGRRPEISAAERPNVVVILADDLGTGDVSALNPQSAWKTPHLDRLAREGRVFTDAHSASVCALPAVTPCSLAGTLGGDG